LQPDLLAALDRLVAETKTNISRPEAPRLAFTDWAIENGYLSDEQEGMQPDELNASNAD
jgi:hypothetical protein